MVQLKGCRCNMLLLLLCISIPNGSIKSEKELSDLDAHYRFQFQMVQLKALSSFIFFIASS